MPASRLIELSLIVTDGGTQSRASINEDVVREYFEAMCAKIEFPPLVVFHDGSTYWLADGFHRYLAAKRADIDRHKCEVHQGTKRDALLFAIGSNAAHGCRRTNADKRHAVRLLLEDAEWSKKSNRWVAKMAGVSDPTVQSVRDELQKFSSSSRSADKSHSHQRTNGEKSGEKSSHGGARNGSGRPPKRTGQDGKARSAPSRQGKPAPSPKTNTIGEIKEQIDACLEQLMDGQPPHVLMVIADHLEELADALRGGLK